MLVSLDEQSEDFDQVLAPMGPGEGSGQGFTGTSLLFNRLMGQFECTHRRTRISNTATCF